MRGGCALAALLVAGACAGCGSGMVRLDAKKVRGLRIDLADRGDTFCPSGLLPEVVAVIDYIDGRVLETRSPANPGGKLRPKELVWSADVGKVEDNGVLDMPLDLLVWYDRVFAVQAQIPGRPDLKAERRITPRFDCRNVADVSGFDGYAGAGGGDGWAGGRGPRVEVALAYVDTKLHGRLVLARVKDRDLGRWEYYLVDPRAGQRLVITADGGDGGAGGAGAGAAGSQGKSGTRGADGASGGMCQDGQDGAPGTDGADGADGQPGGRGGDGGDGGTVTVVYPAGFPELVQRVDISVAGGAGGASGPGGEGGAGGAGGPGGNGGSAGPTSDPNQSCTTRAGNPGREGNKGRDGRHGSAGAAGHAGSPGTISTSPGSVQDLFWFERGRGWAIVTAP